MASPGAFRHRHVLITGASSGIGAALARRFAAGGARIAIVARRAERLAALADEIAERGWQASATGGPVTTPGVQRPSAPVGNGGHTHRPEPVVIVADLFEADAAARVVQEAETALGPIDVLVNNAGLGHFGPFAEAAEHEAGQMIDLNVSALLRLTRLVLPGMLQRRSGWIMNVASAAAYQAMPFMSVYAATKAFVLSFSEGLWAETRGKGVQVTCVNPGTTRTEFFDHHERFGLRAKLLEHGMTADRVAAIAVRALARGKPSVTCGLGNRMAVSVVRLMPRSWVARVTAKVMRPR